MKLFSFAAVGLLAVAATAQTTVTFHDFGTQCGSDLSGSLSTGPRGDAVVLSLTGADPRSIAILALGLDLAATPYSLPNSNCQLLVEPRGALFAFTDASGEASWTLPFVLSRVPPPFSLFAQVVTITIGTTPPRGATFESSDGVEARVQ